jgi:hypothetical protein
MAVFVLADFLWFLFFLVEFAEIFFAYKKEMSFLIFSKIWRFFFAKGALKKLC